MLQYCKDVCRVDAPRSIPKVNRSSNNRAIIEDIPEDRTNVVAMNAMIRKGTHYNAMKHEEDFESPAQSESTEGIKAKRILPNRKHISFGNISSMKDFVEMSEKVNNIETSIKKAIWRPKLGLKTADVEQVNEDTKSISEPQRLPNRLNTFIVHTGLDNDVGVNEQVNNIEQEKPKHYKQNRKTGYEPSKLDDKISSWGREDKQIKKQQIRNLMVDMTKVDENQFGVESKHHKTQKNLTKHVEGLEHSDTTGVSQFGRSKFQTPIDHRSYRRIDEIESYDDSVQEVQSKAYVNKSKQYRKVHPDSISISLDPYVDIAPQKKKKLTYDDEKNIAVREYTLKQSFSEDF
jgi:hypothetical protein